MQVRDELGDDAQQELDDEGTKHKLTDDLEAQQESSEVADSNEKPRRD